MASGNPLRPVLASLTLLATLTPPAFAWDGPRPPAMYAPAAAATLTVSNFSGGSVQVSADGLAARTIHHGQTLSFPVPPGELRVRATYRQFGVERVLQTDRVFVAPGRSAYLALRAETTGRMLVRNLFPVTAQVLVDGRVAQTLRPGEAKVVGDDVGPATLALVADGRTLATARVTLTAFTEPTFTFEPPPVGDLLVVNPLPIPIQLVCDRGMVRTVPAYGRTNYDDLPLGPFHLTARRLTGERVDDATTVVQRGEVTWRVDAPTRGLVLVDSDHFLPTRVRVDGVMLAQLAPDEERRLELALGWHRVEVRDVKDRVVLDTWIDVDPFDLTRVDALAPRPAPVPDRYDDDRHDHDDHDHHEHWDGQVDAGGSSGHGAGCSLPAR